MQPRSSLGDLLAINARCLLEAEAPNRGDDSEFGVAEFGSRFLVY